MRYFCIPFILLMFATIGLGGGVGTYKPDPAKCNKTIGATGFPINCDCAEDLYHKEDGTCHTLSWAESMVRNRMKKFKDEPPVDSTIKTLDEMAQNNVMFLRELSNISCASISKMKTQLKGAVITFEDGTQQLAVPIQTKYIERSESKLEFINDPGFSGDPEIESRKLSENRSGITWFSKDSNSYRVLNLQQAGTSKIFESKDDSVEDKLCAFRSKARRIIQDIDERSGSNSGPGSQR